MVDINESLEALANTPAFKKKKKMQYVEKIFLNKDWSDKSVETVDYSPNMEFNRKSLTVVKGMRIKLKKNHIVEQDFVVLPSAAGDIFIPLEEVDAFTSNLRRVVNSVMEYNGR